MPGKDLFEQMEDGQLSHIDAREVVGLRLAAAAISEVRQTLEALKVMYLGTNRWKRGTEWTIGGTPVAAFTKISRPRMSWWTYQLLSHRRWL